MSCLEPFWQMEQMNVSNFRSSTGNEAHHTLDLRGLRRSGVIPGAVEGREGVPLDLGHERREEKKRYHILDRRRRSVAAHSKQEGGQWEVIDVEEHHYTIEKTE